MKKEDVNLLLKEKKFTFYQECKGLGDMAGYTILNYIKQGPYKQFQKIGIALADDDSEQPRIYQPSKNIESEVINQLRKELMVLYELPKETDNLCSSFYRI